MWRDAVPWLLGPAGIVLGWWLNQRSIQGQADRAAKEAKETDTRERVLQTARLARKTASLLRSLLHAMYLKGIGTPPHGVAEMMAEFNQTHEHYKLSVLSLRVLGPSWAVRSAERIHADAARLAELVFLMQQNFKNEYVQSANSDIPKFDQLVADFVSELSHQFNPEAAALPAPLDLEKEGRWRIESGD